MKGNIKNLRCRSRGALVLTFLLALSVWTFTLKAAEVDTVLTYSASMKKNIKAVVIRPAGYSSSQKFPVLYLLHGYSDNYSSWVTKVPAIKSYADLYHLIIVCPDGAFSSWYFDSPADPTWRYETYISSELTKWIDSHYSTIHDRSGRAITGLSMGGHGALYLAFRHQDVFGAAGSMSGGVDLRPFPLNWDIAKRLGSYSEHPERWEQNSVINLTNLLTPGSLAIIIDCGSEDFFFRVNEHLHQALLYRNIPHSYMARPGGHSWEYWSESIKYQLLFMNGFFRGSG